MTNALHTASQPQNRILATESQNIRRIETMAKARVGQTLAGRFQLHKLIAIGGMASIFSWLRLSRCHWAHMEL